MTEARRFKQRLVALLVSRVNVDTRRGKQRLHHLSVAFTHCAEQRICLHVAAGLFRATCKDGTEYDDYGEPYGLVHCYTSVFHVLSSPFRSASQQTPGLNSAPPELGTGRLWIRGDAVS